MILRRRINLFSCFILVLVCSCQQQLQQTTRVEHLPFFDEASFTPQWIDPDSDELKNFHSISDFMLYNQLGDKVVANDLKGKIVVADFFFTSCPGICKKMTANMSKLQAEFMDDDEILLLSHSVTPLKDSVPILAEYAQVKSVNAKRWYLLTGERSSIYKLGRSDYFVEEDLGQTKGEDEFLHTENFVLLDRESRIRGIYNGLNTTSINQLIIDMKSLK